MIPAQMKIGEMLKTDRTPKQASSAENGEAKETKEEYKSV